MNDGGMIAEMWRNAELTMDERWMDERWVDGW
jgi:hypothetical protein